MIVTGGKLGFLVFPRIETLLSFCLTLNDLVIWILSLISRELLSKSWKFCSRVLPFFFFLKPCTTRLSLWSLTSSSSNCCSCYSILKFSSEISLSFSESFEFSNWISDFISENCADNWPLISDCNGHKLSFKFRRQVLKGFLQSNLSDWHYPLL